MVATKCRIGLTRLAVEPIPTKSNLEDVTQTPIHQRGLTPAAAGSRAKLQVSAKPHWFKPLAILCCLVNALSAATYGKFTYTDNGTYITITDYPTTEVGAVEIPATIISKPVKSIGSNAFSGCSGLTSVTIPEGVTSIGNAAFEGCSSLTNVTIPSSVNTIVGSVFRGCTVLTSVTIPSEVISIGDYTFYGCSSLTSVTIPSTVTSIGNSAFEGCASLTSVVIPSGVTSIGTQEFRGCSRLASVTIPLGVTSIGYMAFSDCSSLASVTIPLGVTNISGYAFYNCWRLTSVTIPLGVTNIGYNTFKNCWRLTSVSLPNGLTSIGVYAFSGCSGLTNVTLPNTVISIEEYAFEYCPGLTSVVIPASMARISNYAFSFCSALSKVTFSGNEPALGANVFMGTNSGIRVYYLNGATGFTTPTWCGYPAFPGGPPQITSAVPPAAKTGTTYSHTCTATGTPTPTFAVISGALPDGLSISNAGVIFGTPTVKGVFTGTITATNDFSPDATQNFSIDTNEYRTLIVGGSNGTVTGGGVYLLNATANLSATANPGYVFTTWSGDSTGNTNPLSLLMDSDKTLGATFAPDTKDDDGDGLTNWQEIVIYRTNPGVMDSDGDGLNDGAEQTAGTNPLLPDTDGDGLTDSEEVNIYHTNPKLADSDGDGFFDGAEVEFYSNPLSIDSVPEFMARTVLHQTTGILQFRFLTQPGKFYTLEASTDLVGWDPLETGIAGTGGTLSRNYPLSSATARWFRAKME